MTDDAQVTWDLVDVIRSGQAEGMPVDWWESAKQWIADHKIELMMRPSERPYEYGYPGASPKQLELAEKFNSRQYRGIFVAGGNRSGKTSAMWHMCGLSWIRDRAKNGEQYWLVAPSFQKLTQDVHQWVYEALPKSMFGDRPYNKANGFGLNSSLELFLPDGRGSVKVVFKSEEQDLQKFESSSVNGVIWTEAEREDVFDALWPRLVDTRGWMLIDYLPTQPWHYTRLKNHDNESWYHTIFSMMDNRHNLPEGTIEQFMATNTQETIDLRVHGKYKITEGIVYKQFNPERHVVEPFEIPKHWPRFRALDHGYDHPAACLWAAMAPDGTLYVYQELYERLHIVRELCEKIVRRSEGESYMVTVADPSIFSVTGSDAGPISDQYMRGGVDVMPGVRSNIVGEHALVDQVKLWFQSDRIKFFGPEKTGPCANAIREHLVWRYKRTHDGLPHAKEQYEDRNNHAVDALKYLIAYGPRFVDESSRGLITIVDDPNP